MSRQTAVILDTDLIKNLELFCGTANVAVLVENAVALLEQIAEAIHLRRIVISVNRSDKYRLFCKTLKLRRVAKNRGERLAYMTLDASLTSRLEKLQRLCRTSDIDAIVQTALSMLRKCIAEIHDDRELAWIDTQTGDVGAIWIDIFKSPLTNGS